jgi:hypothetical protein
MIWHKGPEIRTGERNENYNTLHFIQCIKSTFPIYIHDVDGSLVHL